MKQSFLIGLLVIISQTVVTTIVLLGFCFLYSGYDFPKMIIMGVLIYDCVAIVLHMLYRKREKKLLQNKGAEVFAHKKVLLIIHASASVLAISLGVHLLSISISAESLSLLFILWTISLVTGIIIFYKKYSRSF